ncbi:MAG: acylphosphatase [Verrucomicrobia bacterium]|nr:acylphosphatase [Verrucomicrobiota bacterium]
MVHIEGRVQGVWYRGWTVDQASARGLSGWVRNRRDGSVEAVFCGSETIVGEMVCLCWAGPPAARVTNVTVRTVEITVADGFSQLATL